MMSKFCKIYLSDLGRKTTLHLFYVTNSLIIDIKKQNLYFHFTL